MRAHFGPFFVSLGSLSPKQPNHGHFGTDVESSIIQRVGDAGRGQGLQNLRSGGVNRDRTLRFGHISSGSRGRRGAAPSGTSRRERIPCVCLEREPGLNHGAVAVTSELDPAGLAADWAAAGLLEHQRIRPDRRVCSDVLGLQSGRSWGGSLRSGGRRNPLAFTAARAHSTIMSARSATRAEPDEVAAERSSKKRLTRV